jgi:hypothetical protein
MGGASGRYAPSSPSHSEEHAFTLFKRNVLKLTGVLYLNFRGVKIGLSQGVNFRLSFLEVPETFVPAIIVHGITGQKPLHHGCNRGCPGFQ